MRVIGALWHNDLRHYMIVLNGIAFLALAGYLIATVLSPKRAKSEEKSPANLTEFYKDEDLEGRRLERVQGWALVFAAITAVALPLYWLREPTRQDKANNYFDKNSVERGATLFANSSMTAYDAASSLQCANCHGTKGEGGVAPATINGVKVSWKAPPLNTELLRFSEDEVRQIITFGRPGTPMQPWGVEGGGPKNDQAINDLIAFIKSIQLTPAQAQQEEVAALAAARDEPAAQVKSARAALKADTTALATTRKSTQATLGLAGATDDQLETQCKSLDVVIKLDSPANLKKKGKACSDFRAAKKKVGDDQTALAWAIEWQRRRVNVSDGQLLFEINCARCHTAGWSVFDPTAPPGTAGSVDLLGLQGGGGGTGGGIGFNLRDNEGVSRFGHDPDGFFAQVKFVSNGSILNQPYGNGGIGNGRMPGFNPDKDQNTLGAMLTPAQVQEIVKYERDCLAVTTFTGVTPVCATDESTWPTSTTTTSTTVGK
ncbi:MAG TPA: cytochrome c [Acidimicrobiia bacterium]|nr:cytochrome c [Acidimicrobiia bacterium]